MIGLYVLDKWSVLCVPYVGVMRSNIAIRVYVLDMWSVLCVIITVGGMGSNIVIGM